MGTIALRTLLLASLFGASVCFAADPKAPKEAEKLDSTKNHMLSNIDILGQEALGTMFILSDHFDLNLDVVKAIEEKSFATDEFYMQNIDREQFEQERLLRLFGNDRKQYFQLFPDSSKTKERDDDE